MSNMKTVKEYMTTQAAKIQNAKNNIDVEDLKKQYDKYQKEVKNAFDVMNKNKVGVEKTNELSRNYMCNIHSGDGGDPALKKKYCK